ncbi:siphovirus Gp157 family protein [Lentilactobacillus kosonis]|uniref:Phage protein n=1 Tax=Lentilactobacillus kosonis TaxID=2810561 RepID=A0A401FPK1_9LACO|nr:siphovirus Gp157 family protein [Lentilactobacillus kosonis]GAY74319.1 phage protein [Lentilactobacillus kosonis]
MANLYDLTQSYQELLDALENTESDPKLIEDTIASTGINEQVEDKFEAYGQVINQLKSDEEIVSAEIKRLTTKKRTYQNNLQRLRMALIDSMAAIGKDKVKTSLFSFSIKNTRSVDIVDESKLPESVLNVQPPKPDKKAIKELIESGEQVPGATISFNESLMIR